MDISRKIISKAFPVAIKQSVKMHSSKAGAIKEAGGSFAKRESALEEEFMMRQQREQLEKLKQEGMPAGKDQANKADKQPNAQKK